MPAYVHVWCVYAGAHTYLEALGGQWSSFIALHIIPFRQGLSLNLDLAIFQLASVSDTPVSLAIISPVLVLGLLVHMILPGFLQGC